MAETNEEIIGAIGVSVTGDYSSLAASYSSAQDQAQAAGEAIADAFNEGVSGVSDAASEVTDALGGIGPAGDDAAGGLDTFGESASGAGEAAEEAGGKLAEMAEQLTAIGEALVVTEGLTELGSEALGAADSITKASIALTTMTGSSEEAHETIEQLEQLGMTDGLAMPSLLTAAQRMTALLPEGTDVVAVLGQVADGAAAMGTDIESAAQRFDMIVNAGTLSARALTSLGLSLQSVTNALNQVDPSAAATTDTVTAMFKAMDPGQRIQVLQDALSALGGTAQQVAQQTFGGQWQQLADAWEGVMVQVGQAILPVVSELLDLTKTDIVPFIQDAVLAFNGLPEPIKDTAVVVGLAAAAIIPLTGALAALGLAFSGLEGLLPAVTGLMETFGAASAEVAVEETAAAAATEGLEVAAGAAEVGIGALAGVIGIGLVAGLAAAAFGFTDLQASLKNAYSGFEEFSQSSFSTWIQAQIAGLKTAQLTTEDAAVATAKFQQALDLGVISAQQFKSAVDGIATAQQNLASQDMAGITAQYSDGLKILTDTTQKATDQQTLLNDVLTAAQTAFQKVSAEYQAGTATAAQYISAQGAVQKATEAVATAQNAASNALMETAIEQAKADQENQVAVAGMQDWLTTSEATLPIQKQQLAALQDLSAALPPLVSQFAGLDGQITALQSAMPGFGVIVTSLSSGPMVGLQSALDEAKAKVAGLAQQMADGANVGMQYEKALTAQLNAQIALDSESATLATGLQGATDAVSLASIAVADAQAKYDDLVNAWQAGQPVLTQLQSAQKALTTAQTELTTATNGTTSAVTALDQAYPNLTAAANATTTAIGAQVTSLQQDLSALSSVAAAVNSISADMQSAFGASSTISGGGAGTHVSITGYGDFGQPIYSVTEGPTPQQTYQQALTAAQALMPAKGTSATALAQDALAQAQAVLQVDQQFVGQGVGVTVQDVQTAETAVATAQAALAALTGGSSSSTGGAGIIDTSGLLINTTIPTPTLPGSTSTAASTAASSVPVATSASGSGTSAVDGGSYPAVTAHQATGEVWAVDTSGVASSGGAGSASSISEQISTVVNQTSDTSTGQLTTAVSAIGGAVQQLATNNGTLLPIAVSLSTTAAATQQIAEAISGLVTKINTGGVTSGAAATVVGGSGTAYSVGPSSSYSGSGNPQGPTVPGYNSPPASAPVASVPGYNPFGPTSTGGSGATTVNVSVDARGSMGLNPQQMAQVVVTQVTQQLFTNGARITR